MFQIVKDNFVYIILVIVAFVAGIYFIPPRATETYNKIVETNSARKLLSEKESQLNNLRLQAEASSRTKTTIL